MRAWTKWKQSAPTFKRLMSPFERLGASMVGVALSGGGAVAVFVTENQAGSTALILVGAVFLIVSVQGTPILKASKDAVELKNREEEVVKKVEEAVVEQGPDKAELILEGALSADPALSEYRGIAELSAFLYESRARIVLERVAGELSAKVVAGGPGDIYDFLLLKSGSDSDPRGVAVDIKYLSRANSLPFNIIERSLKIRHAYPQLLVANVRLSAKGRDYLAYLSDQPFDFVQWSGNEADQALERKVREMLGA